jgi:hypothetical protein
MSQENVEIVRRQIEAFNRGDLAGALEQTMTGGRPCWPSTAAAATT